MNYVNTNSSNSTNASAEDVGAKPPSQSRDFGTGTPPATNVASTDNKGPQTATEATKAPSPAAKPDNTAKTAIITVVALAAVFAACWYWSKK